MKRCHPLDINRHYNSCRGREIHAVAWNFGWCESRASVVTLYSLVSFWNNNVCQTALFTQHRFKFLESSLEGFGAMVEVRSCRFDSRVFPGITLDPPWFLASASCSTGSASRGSGSLKGRSCLTLKDFSSDEIKSLLWVSRDLKHRIKVENQVNKHLYSWGDRVSLTAPPTVIPISVPSYSARQVDGDDIWEEEHENKSVYRDRCRSWKIIPINIRWVFHEEHDGWTVTHNRLSARAQWCKTYC